ncbi:two-component system, OmpR family, sensor histidine kinase TctE [Roseateles sp. YR242]|uniref:sensor histidine kinase n=1 Tax=Roseateles sp. YR242 TaxID=1855305 RepID=UPI0008CBA13A|nr:sensor histidine kinase [Roseateles sp. YR242]SEL84214.1 two-component system, OmpR family, sensor histidine kinase TctE [Roseateles sp. YR242]
MTTSRARLSLKQRLLLWLMVPVLVAVPLGGAVLYRVMHDTAISWLDQSLGDTALAVASLIHERDGQIIVDVSGPTDSALRFDRTDSVYYLVLDPDGRPLHGDESLKRLTLPHRAAGEWYFTIATLDGEALRVAVLGAACGFAQTCQILVAETLHKRDELQQQLVVVVSLLIGGMAVLLAAAGWWATHQGLRPLSRLSAELERRDLARLDPLEPDVPGELRPLIAAFNRLFERLRRASSAQQDFLANAAHQLRTPLTSLRTDIDLALLEPHDPQVEPLLKRLQKSVDRSARLAQQMLSIARAEAEPAQRDRPLDLRDIAAQVAEDWVPRMLETGMDLGFELSEAAVLGQGFLLRELLENLLHNSLNYAGPGARITVRTGTEGDWAHLEVEDNGPGIAPAERARALQRFQRGSEAKATGSGLGLAIAVDIAQRHDGRLELLDATAGQGLRVRLSMPRRSQAPLKPR